MKFEKKCRKLYFVIGIVDPGDEPTVIKAFYNLNNANKCVESEFKNSDYAEIVIEAFYVDNVDKFLNFSYYYDDERTYGVSLSLNNGVWLNDFETEKEACAFASGLEFGNEYYRSITINLDNIEIGD